jgi:hypothetical protein
MFEPVEYFSCCPASVGSLSRLNSKLFSMLIDSAFRSVPHGRGKPTINTTSNFIGPNQ